MMKQNILNLFGSPVVIIMLLHESFVIISDLLNVDVVFGVDVRFGGAVGVGNSNNGSDVLKIRIVFDFHLSHTRVSVSDFDHGGKSRRAHLHMKWKRY